MDPNTTKPQLIDPTVWLITGVLIGTLFHAPTAIALIICWLIIRNNPLPEVIGGKHPQDIIVDLVNMGWLLMLRIFSNKYRIDKETTTAVVTSLLSRTISTPAIVSTPTVSTNTGTGLTRISNRPSTLRAPPRSIRPKR